MLLSQPRYIPDADRLIERGRSYQIVLWMKLSAHHIMIVASHGADYRKPSSQYPLALFAATRSQLTQRPVLPVPYPNCLIVGTGQNPGKLVVKENRPHIVQMAVQREKASPRLVTPHFDLVVITSGNEEGLRLVEVDASDGTIVLFESVNKSSHPIIPQLDGRGMKRHKDPWPEMGISGEAVRQRGPSSLNRPFRMESNPFRSGRF